MGYEKAYDRMSDAVLILQEKSNVRIGRAVISSQSRNFDWIAKFNREKIKKKSAGI